MKSPVLMSRAVVNGVLVIGAAYMLFPIIWLATATTKSLDQLYTSSMFEVSPGALVSNLQDLSNEGGGIFWRWFVNSFLYAGLGAAIGALTCAAAGYAFDKYAFWGKEKLFGLVLVGVLIPTTAMSLPLYLLASKLGVVNTFWSVFIPVLTFPFGVYLARVYSSSYVPSEVLEAARVDGSSELRTFVSVALPMMKPGLVTVFLFQFIGIWNNFFLPLVMLSDNKLFPTSLGLYVWNSNTTAMPRFYPLVIAGAFASVIPLLIAFILLQRFWRSGMNSGSVK